MAKKNSKVFECSNCGHQEAKWSGKCPSCGEWNTMAETIRIEAARPGGTKSVSGAARVQKLGEIEIRRDIRLQSGIRELDRVLGGGVLKGSSVLLGGEPGIGKSTLMLQAAGAYAKNGTVLYISGEEAAGQIKMRAQRLGIDGADISILTTSSTEECADAILRLKPVLIVVDSIQTLLSSESGSSPGSPNQIKFSVQTISECSRAVGASIYFIAHVTKEGAIAGPKLVEHLVDAVLYFDQSGHEMRYIRANKNRFGSTDEIGLFTMEAKGLVPLEDISRIFLSEQSQNPPSGTAISPVYEGSRTLLVEIQALTVAGKGGFGRVYSDKIDQRRVSRVAAVLEKHLNLKLSDQDIYVNVAGGVKIQDVGTDLALAMALYSARTGIALPPSTALCGEVSLSGGIRPVHHLKQRIQQAADMGYRNIIAATSQESEAATSAVSHISETVKKLYS